MSLDKKLRCTVAVTAMLAMIPVSSVESANVLTFAIDCEPVSKRTDAVVGEGAEPPAEADQNDKENCLLPNINSRNKAILDLVLTIKTAADEKYINGDISAATERYHEARDFLKEVNLGKSVLGEPIGESSELDLLSTDIGYRLKLLSAGADFWGTGFSSHPANPVKLLAELHDNFDDFNKIVTEIDAFQSTSVTTDIQQATIRALYNEASSEAQAELWKVEQSGSAVRSADTAKNYLIQQLVDNARRQEEIKSELENVWKEVDRIGDQISDVALNAAAQAVGIPPELSAIATSGGDIEEKLVSLGTSLLADSDFANSLIASSADLSEFYEAAASAQNLVAEIQENTQLVRTVYDGFRDGFNEQNLRKMVSLGGELLEKLEITEGGIQEVGKIIADVKSLVETGKIDLATVFEVALLDQTLEERLFSQISTMVGADIKIVGKQIADDTTRLVSAFEVVRLAASDSKNLSRQFQAMILGNIISYPSTAQQINVVIAPDDVSDNSVVSAFLPEFRSQVENALDVSVDSIAPENLIATIEQALQSDILKLNIEFDGMDKPVVTVRLRDDVFDLSDSLTKELFDVNAQIQSQLQSTRTEFKDLFGAESFDAVVRHEFSELLTRVAADDMSKVTRTLLSRGLMSVDQATDFIAGTTQVDVASVRKDILNQLGGLGDEVLNPLASLMVAKEISPALRSNHVAPLPTSFAEITPRVRPALRSSEADPTPVEEQVAAMLIANTVPGGTFVAAAAQVAKALSQMDLAIQKGNELYNEDKALAKAQIHLADMIASNRDARDLAAFEQTIAEVRGRGAAASSNSYLQAIVQSSDKMSDAQAQARLRVPLAIFHAEQMRRTFDELNHALALWVGSSGSPRGTIERLVREDPQYIRLALDNDIQLYRWLLRDGEGDRTDLRSLVNHWRQIVAITNDVCRRVGCSPDAAVVGPVKQTGEVSIRNLVGDGQWRRFLDWAESADPAPFAFRILFTPSDGHIKAEFQLVRAVDVGVGIKYVGSTDIHSLNSTWLRHPGVAYVAESDGSYLKEFYPLKTKYDLSWNSSFDTDQLRMRWSRDADLSQRDFEGYGLYTIWELNIGRADVPDKPDDLFINFAYQYHAAEDFDPFAPRIPIPEVVDVDTVNVTSSNSPRGFSSRDIELISDPYNFCPTIEQISHKLNDVNLRIDLEAAKAGAELETESHFTFECERL